MVGAILADFHLNPPATSRAHAAVRGFLAIDISPGVHIAAFEVDAEEFSGFGQSPLLSILYRRGHCARQARVPPPNCNAPEHLAFSPATNRNALSSTTIEVATETS